MFLTQSPNPTSHTGHAPSPRPEVQDKLNVFRAEGFVALDAWFRKGLRHSPTVADMLSRWAW